MLCLILGWPPSVNHYWETSGNRRYISKAGTDYIHAVRMRLPVCELYTRFKGVYLRMHVDAYPPDKRKRDLDNICKALLDSIQKAGIIDDDYYISDLRIVRKERCEGGRVVVNLEEIIPLT